MFDTLGRNYTIHDSLQQEEQNILDAAHLEFVSEVVRRQTKAEFKSGIEIANELAERLKRRRAGALVRNDFIARRRENDVDRTIPLVTILQSGRSNQVRLALELTMLWVAVGEDHEAAAPARQWSQLLGLDDDRGPRQIRSNLRWLADHRLLHLLRGAKNMSRVRLRRDDGTGAPYDVPDGQVDNRYVAVPTLMWTNGWIQMLSAPAMAMLLVFEHHQRSRGERLGLETGLWFSESYAHTRYELSSDTRYRGIEELQRYGLVRTHYAKFKTRSGTQIYTRAIHNVLFNTLDYTPAEAALLTAQNVAQRRLERAAAKAGQGGSDSSPLSSPDMRGSSERAVQKDPWDFDDEM